MIDIFTILLSHSLIVLVGWRLLFRDDLDTDYPKTVRSSRPWAKDQADNEAAGDA